MKISERTKKRMEILNDCEDKKDGFGKPIREWRGHGASANMGLPTRTHAIHMILFFFGPMTLQEIKSKLKEFGYHKDTIDVTEEHLASMAERDEIIVEDGVCKLTSASKKLLSTGDFFPFDKMKKAGT